MSRFTRRQWLILSVFSVAQFCNALCISIQAPFYPKEAEDKGATPSQYGFVFGIYELVVFICSPIYGKFLNRLGSKLVNNTGMFTVSVTCILFGALEKINDTSAFIGYSFAIRIIEATGTSAFTTAAFSIIAKEFPQNVASTFALLETFFGVGLILGPTVGGALYEVGGFHLPFVSIGSLLLCTSFLILCVLPNSDETYVPSTLSIFSLLRKPPIFIGSLTVFGGSFSIGFVQATLEPHLRILTLSPLQLGLMFVLNGASYALSAPIWGKLCDKCITPQSVWSAGTLLISTAFVLMGPAPYLPLSMTLPTVIVALIIHGLGMGAELVGTFSGFHKDVLALGFPDNIGTYGLVSGLWNSSFALGAFAGPSLAGVLFDVIGFAWASQLVVGLHLMLFTLTVTYMLFFRKLASEAHQVTSETIEEEPFIRRSSNLIDSYGSVSPREL